MPNGQGNDPFDGLFGRPVDDGPRRLAMPAAVELPRQGQNIDAGLAAKVESNSPLVALGEQNRDLNAADAARDDDLVVDVGMSAAGADDLLVSGGAAL